MTTTRDRVSDRESLLEELLLAREIEQFLYAEAELLDQRRYEEWLNLLTDDVRFWMPMRRNVKFNEWERENTRVGEDLNWLEDNKITLRQRVGQLLTGVHWAEEPVSRLCHVVAAVQIVSSVPEAWRPSEVAARCRFVIYRNRLQTETDLFVGRREDVLRREDGLWKIASRKIYLDQNILLAKNLTFFF